jgi:hypothetical protein
MRLTSFVVFSYQLRKLEIIFLELIDLAILSAAFPTAGGH